MAVFYILLLAVPGCFSCNVHTVPRNRAKVVEEYVVSAKFDENKNIPQLNAKNKLRDIYEEDKKSSRPQPKDASISFSPSFFVPFSSPDGENNIESKDTLEERDLLVQHHHLPPPPAGLAFGPSLFAVGLITFLILLNSLQTSLLLILKPKGSVLGTVTGALGRKKRSTLPNFYTNLEKYRN